MMSADKKLRVDIVNVESSVFSGEADALIVMGTMGELGILPGHSPLLTSIKPGEARIKNGEQEELFYVSGGILEVQPDCVTLLADTVIRAKDIDEAAALEAQQRAEKALKDRKENVDYYAAAAELAETLAQLRALRRYRNQS